MRSSTTWPASRVATKLPTFIGGLELNEQTQQFVPLGEFAPARLGMGLIAFDVASQITPGLQPQQYQVHSVSVTVTYQNGTNGILNYADAPATNEQIRQDLINGTAGKQRPMEMYGVGFRDGLARLRLRKRDEPRAIHAG